MWLTWRRKVLIMQNTFVIAIPIRNNPLRDRYKTPRRPRILRLDWNHRTHKNIPEFCIVRNPKIIIKLASR